MTTGAPIDLGYPLLQQLRVLEHHRSPAMYPQSWVHPVIADATESDSFSGKPLFENPATSGRLVKDNLFAVCGVRLRKDQNRRRSWLRVDTADAAKNYGPTFGLSHDSQVVSGVAGNAATTITNLKTALDANSDWIAANGETSVVSGNTSILEMRTPRNEPIFINFGGSPAQDGNPYSSMTCEATQCYWRVWGKEMNHDHWGLVPNQTWVTYDSAEFMLVNCAEYERLFVEVVWCNGSVLPFVGECVLDTGRDTPVNDARTLLTTRDDTELYTFPATLVGDQPELLTAAESAYDSLTDGILTEGLSAIAVHFKMNSANTFDHSLDVFGDHFWSQANDSAVTGTGGTNPTAFSELYYLNGSKRAGVRVSTHGGGDLYRWYQRLDKRHAK